jgi:hypothetical protein
LDTAELGLVPGKRAGYQTRQCTRPWCDGKYTHMRPSLIQSKPGDISHLDD